MTPDTPEPQPPDGRGAPRSDGSEPPLPPRVLVSVGDFEDPAEWDVIVVENDAVDDETARAIARQRAGHRRSLPSLDEHDVAEAFATGRDEEDAEGPHEVLTEDAFAAPAGPAVRRRVEPPALPPPGDELFGDVGQPVELPEAASEERLAPPGAEPDGWSADDVVAMESPAGPHRRVTEEELEAELGDYPQAADEPDDVDDGTGIDESELPVELAADPDLSGSGSGIEMADDEPEADAAEAAPIEDAVVAPVGAGASVATDAEDTEPEPAADAGEPERAELLDDPADDFYAIDGEHPVADETPGDTGDTADNDAQLVGSVWDPAPVEGERALLDDPGHDFYDLGPDANAPSVAAAAAGAAVAAQPDPAERLGADLWGAPPEEPAADATAGDAAREPGDDPADLAAEDAPAEDAPAEVVADDEAPDPFAEALGEDYEDEVEFDSSFPLGPGDLGIVEEALPVELDSLDYAAVFGPVQGALPKPDLDGGDAPAAPRRPRPAYQDDLYVQDAAEAEDEDDEDRWMVPPARRGRRRELLALGIAAGIMIAIGIGSQIYSSEDPKLEEANTGSSSSSVTPSSRTRSSEPELTLPSLPTDTTQVLGTDGGDGPVTTRRPPRTTTTRPRPGGAPTTAPVTTAPPTTPPPTTAPPTTPPPTTSPPTSTPTDGGTDGVDTTGGAVEGTDSG